MSLLDFFRTKKLSSVLNQSFRVKVHGVVFLVRKINPLDFMAGYKALSQPFDTYKTEKEKQASLDLISQQTNKMKEHYADVFLSAVVEPKLVRKAEDQDKGIWVENLFSDWELANDLYQKIMEVTYGKKKMKLLTSQKISS